MLHTRLEYQFPHIKRCVNRFWYDPPGSNPLSVFYKKLLVGQGWDLLAIRILIRKSKTFFGFAVRFFAVIAVFHLKHSRLICGFFRSIDLRNTGPLVPLILFGILPSSLAFGIQEIILL